MKFKQYLAEAKTNTVVFAFGRFNPISTGHELLANKVAAVAKQHNGKALVVASASVDPKKNPLSVDDKVKYMRKAFTNVEVQSAKKYGSTFIDVAKKLSSEGVKNLALHIPLVAVVPQ
jgi:phosphopantetheine adenylyltransferase